jgi:DNA repair protein RadC
MGMAILEDWPPLAMEDPEHQGLGLAFTGRVMKITSPELAFRFFKPLLTADIEEFWVAALNTQKAVTAQQCLFRGTVDHCLFHPRDVFRFAYMHNASSLVVAHNHPSGNLEPSDLDRAVTEQLLQIALIMEVPLVDHLILAGGNYFSFLENGWPTGRVSF